VGRPEGTHGRGVTWAVGLVGMDFSQPEGVPADLCHSQVLQSDWLGHSPGVRLCQGVQSRDAAVRRAWEATPWRAVEKHMQPRLHPG
jgi:hypothetical protein